MHGDGYDHSRPCDTYSMALATVNIDKIIKVTSASSYVYLETGLRQKLGNA